LIETTGFSQQIQTSRENSLQPLAASQKTPPSPIREFNPMHIAAAPAKLRQVKVLLVHR